MMIFQCIKPGLSLFKVDVPIALSEVAMYIKKELPLHANYCIQQQYALEFWLKTEKQCKCVNHAPLQ